MLDPSFNGIDVLMIALAGGLLVFARYSFARSRRCVEAAERRPRPAERQETAARLELGYDRSRYAAGRRAR